MREFIKTVRITGQLSVEDKYVFENVKCEYSHDIYSNKNMVGNFEIDEITPDFEIDFTNLSNFIFNGNSTCIEGKLTGFSFSEEHVLKFKINKITEWSRYGNKASNKLIVEYNIPYTSLLARHLKHYWDYGEDYIVKFDSEEFKINIENIFIYFHEYASLTKYKEPDLIFNRMLTPKVTLEFNTINKEEINEKLKYLENVIRDMMIILSLLFFKRVNFFGYTADLLDDSNKLLQKISYKTAEMRCGEDYIEKDNSHFNKYFNEINISKLVECYRNLEKYNKEKYLRVLYAYITIGELNIFEPKFRDVYYAIEAISKIIVKPICNTKPEELISLACDKSKVDLSQINFLPATKSKELKWLISEYRNELTHYNFDSNFQFDTLVKEYNKMMNLLRKLMISYLEPSLNDFPYPRDRYRLY